MGVYGDHVFRPRSDPRESQLPVELLDWDSYRIMVGQDRNVIYWTWNGRSISIVVVCSAAVGFLVGKNVQASVDQAHFVGKFWVEDDILHI